MSNIEDLRQNEGNDVERIDMTSGERSTKHSVVTPDFNNRNIMPTKSSDREKIDLTELVPQEEKSDDIHESYVQELIGDQPDSLLSRYVAQKQEEAAEYIAQLEQQEELEGDTEEDATGFMSQNNNSDETAEIGYESSYRGQPVEIAQTSGNITVVDEDVEELKENIPEPTIEPVIEQNKPEKKEEKVIENPNIDLEVNVLDNKASEEKNDDLMDDMEDSGNKVDDDEVLEHLQKLATEKIKPIAKTLDLSSFTIMKKPTANIKALQNTNIKAAKWVLPTQESIVLMKEFLGSELENLREASEDTANLSQMYRKYRSIYDHIVSPKPANYEAWLKSTPYSDSDHYFFAAYIASFKGANYLPLDCENKKCAKTILTDDMPILDLVKFDDEKSKEFFTNLYTSENTYAGKGIYVSEVVPLSDKLAIGFKDASIYNLFEVYSLNQADREKYSSILEFIPYIDSLYIIHPDTMELEPIGYKVYPDNPTKTIRSKVNVFFKALQSLSVDEFTPIRSFVRNITNHDINIRYKYPSIKCPYCGTMTKEVESTAEQLLFVRYQLGALANTSLK